MNSKMRTDSQLSTTKLKKQNKNKNELRKQLEQEQNHRNGWVWLQNKGKSEGYAKWNKENIQGNNREGKETRTRINDFKQKEEINI